MKKIWLVLLALLASSGSYLAYKFYFEETQNLNAIYLVPKDAVYVVSSEDPIGNWKEIRKSALWQHLRTNAYFAELTKSANTLDTLLNDNQRFFDFLGAKRILVSAHVLNRHKFDHLYIVDLQRSAKIGEFKTILKKVLSQQFTLTSRDFKEVEILELLDRTSGETLYMAFVNNNLILSYTHILVENAIAQKDDPALGRDLNFLDLSKKTGSGKMLQIYVQYAYLNAFAGVFDFADQAWLKQISDATYFTGLDIDLIDGNKIFAEGYTNLNDEKFSYLLAMQNAGTGNHDIAKVAPLRTGAYISFGFDSYSKFYENYLQLQEKNPENYKNIKENQEQIEKWLKIDIQKNFFDWIDDEIAYLKFETEKFGVKNDFALVIKAKSQSEAQENLNFIAEQVRKRTPVKFKEVDYKGHTISFMSVKGFFKFFLGGFFKKLDTPYFTQLDDFVIFTNSPNTLKYIINHYDSKNTLDQSEFYQKFNSNFENKSNVFVYINTPRYYESFSSNFTASTKTDLAKNKKYFTGFTQFGLQLLPKDDLFKNIIAVQHYNPDEIENILEFRTDEEMIDDEDDNEAVIQGVTEETDIFIPEINPDDFNANDFKTFYTTGELLYEVELKDGKKHGTYREYFPNGETKIKGKFKDDQPWGTWKKYDSIGNLIVKKKFDN